MLSRRRPTRNHRQSRGVTLLELLIVMTIMLMVTAAAIPVVMPALQNRRMREASRLASSFISGARARAIETGRPAGVMLERFNGQPFAMSLSYVEVPPPYGGDTAGSKMFLAVTGTFPGQTVKITGFVPPADYLWTGIVRYGDVVRLDSKGPTYVLASQSSLPDPQAGKVVTDPSTTPWFLVGAAPINLPANFGSTGVTFQIMRQPVRSVTTPLQLPEGTVIDLISSGVGTSAAGSFNTNAGIWSAAPLPAFPFVPFNPVIMFGPSGSVVSVTSGPAGTPGRPTGPIFLLVGRRELMFDITASDPVSPTLKDLVDRNLSAAPSTPPPGAPPLTDAAFWLAQPRAAPPENFWVSVGQQTGQVTVTEVAPNRQDYEQATQTPGDTLPDAVSLSLTAARAFAQSGQSAGGR